MPDTQKSAKQDFSAYDLMSDKELENLLRSDFSKPMGEESDLEMVLYIMEVLAQRRKDRSEGKSPEDAWESFKQNYTEDICSFTAESVPAPQTKRAGYRKWGLIATAAVLALVIGTSITAKAFIFDSSAPIASWTNEEFFFKHNKLLIPIAIPQHPNRSALLPTWIPEGYVLIDSSSPAGRNGIVQAYMKGNQLLWVRVFDYDPNFVGGYSKDENPVEVYRSNGIDYYFFTNGNRRAAVWITENQECSIIGPLSKDEIKKMIDSIGKG